MAYITIPKIQRSNTTTTTDYDILNDDLDLLAQLKEIEPDFPEQSIPMDVSVFLETGAGCQIQVNGSEYQDFLADISYSLDNVTNIKSAKLSATGVVYTVSLTFE